jgi:NitT/TauT family transport system substrate-binding protein
MRHPKYANYEFNKDDKVINLGTQPVYMPTGLISEMMKRDAILEQALSEIGRQIRFYPFLKGDDVNFFLKRGDLDAGIGGDMPALTAAATFDIVVTNLVQQGFTSIIAGKYMLISGLRGKRIGYAFGSNAHYSLLQALAGAGLDEKNVRLIPMDVNRMPQALRSGDIDAFSAWEPTPSIALKKQNDAVIIHRNLSSGYLYFLKTFSDENHEAVKHIVASAIRAIRWMQVSNENLIKACSWTKKTAEELIGENIELSSEEIAELAKKDIIGMRQPCRIPDSSLEDNTSLHDELEFLKASGKIPVSADWNDVWSSFDRRIVNEVLAGPKEYRIYEYDYLGEGGGDG